MILDMKPLVVCLSKTYQYLILPQLVVTEQYRSYSDMLIIKVRFKSRTESKAILRF